MATFSANLLKEAHESLNQDMKASGQLRQDVEGFMNNVKETITGFEEMMQSTSRQIEAIVHEVRTDVECFEAKRTCDEQCVEGKVNTNKEQPQKMIDEPKLVQYQGAACERSQLLALRERLAYVAQEMLIQGPQTKTSNNGSSKLQPSVPPLLSPQMLGVGADLASVMDMQASTKSLFAAERCGSSRRARHDDSHVQLSIRGTPLPCAFGVLTPSERGTLLPGEDSVHCAGNEGVVTKERTNGALLSRTCTNGSPVASDPEVALNGGRQPGSTEFAHCVAHGRMPHASALCSDFPSATTSLQRSSCADVTEAGSGVHLPSLIAVEGHTKAQTDVGITGRRTP